MRPADAGYLPNTRAAFLCQAFVPSDSQLTLRIRFAGRSDFAPVPGVAASSRSRDEGNCAQTVSARFQVVIPSAWNHSDVICQVAPSLGSGGEGEEAAGEGRRVSEVLPVKVIHGEIFVVCRLFWW